MKISITGNKIKLNSSMPSFPLNTILPSGSATMNQRKFQIQAKKIRKISPSS